MIGTSVFTVFSVVKVFVVATLGFAVALLFTPFWSKFLAKFKLDKQLRSEETAPVFAKLHKGKEGTPTMGGVIIWGSVIILVVILSTLARFFPNTIFGNLNFMSRETVLPLGILVLSGILGAVDDMLGILRKGVNGGGLRMRIKIVLYVLIAVVGAGWFYDKLDRDFINIPFLGDYTVGLWYIPIFIFIIFATAFSANEADGLDGLAGGIFLIMFAAYGAIAFVQGRLNVVVFVGAIMGALVAFLWSNIYPARFFMGDTGSMALGVTLGIVAFLTDTPLLLPLIGVIFLLESLSVMIQVLSKKIRKKKVFLSTPIHHHFEAVGWHETRVTMRFWMINAIGAIAGLIIFLVDSKLPPLF